MGNRVGQQLGNYRLLRLIGQGGFADVYLGEHIHLNTLAAIKVLQMRVVESNVEQFRNEARVIASLQHPHIVRLLEFGVEGDVPFFVMDYAANGTLRQRFSPHHPLPLNMLVSIIKQVASALQYAHNRRLIHRDIKPENILLGVDDTVLLSDFGLVLIAQSSSSRSQLEMAGTAAYMAPEQLQGKPRLASDQYSLGIVAYECLAGELPFTGSFLEIASQHMLTPPSSLREKLPDLPEVLEDVIMKALAKEPQQRFASIQDFAEAFERACTAIHENSILPLQRNTFMAPVEHVQVPARSPYETIPVHTASAFPTFSTPGSQNVPFAKGTSARLPMQKMSLAAVPVSASESDMRPKTSDIEEANTKLQPASKGISRRVVVGGLLGTIGLGVTGTALWTLSDHFPGLSTPSKVQPKRTPSPHPTVRPTQDPQLVEGKILYTLPSTANYWAADWSPDGKYLAASGDDSLVHIWDVRTGQLVSTYRGHVQRGQGMESKGVAAIAWSPDSTRLASVGLISLTSGFQPDIQVWRFDTGNMITTYTGHNPQPGHENIVGTLSWSPDGTRIVSAGMYDQTAQIWNATTGQTLVVYRGHQADVGVVRWSPDGKYIASGSGHFRTFSAQQIADIQVWNTTGHHLLTYTGHGNSHIIAISDLCWSPDSQMIASVEERGSIHVWKALSGIRITEYAGDRVVSWSPNGRRIVTLSQGESYEIQIMDALTGMPSYTFSQHTQQINVVTWSPDSKYLASCGLDKRLLVWNA